MIIFFLQLLTIVNALPINLAKGKTSKDCTGASLSAMVTDGSWELENTVLVNSCRVNTFVEIHLGDNYEVHYVLVYEGNNPTPALEQMAYFKVKLKLLKTWPCGEFSRKSLGRGIPMRVNCRPGINLVSKVIVETRNNESIHISEIEVYNIGIGTPKRRLLVHRGCFLMVNNDTILGLMVKEPVIHNCQHKCIDMETSYLGIKRRLCHCFNDISTMVEIQPESCNDSCEDVRCGGDDYFSIYIGLLRLPTYHGCYKTSEYTGDMLALNVMTVEACIKYCDDSHYALLMNGSKCFCKSGLFDLKEEVYDGCTKRCQGHYSSFCGGMNLASVYQTCKGFDEKSKSCFHLMRCNTSTDVYGQCNGACMANFKGKYCFERERGNQTPTFFDENSTNVLKIGCPPDHCRYFPNTECLLEEGQPVCQCKEGFQKSQKGFCIAVSNTADDNAYSRPAPMFIIIPSFCLVIILGICCLGSQQAHEEELQAKDSDSPKSRIRESGISVKAVVSSQSFYPRNTKY